MKRTIARNIAANWVGFGVHVVVAFFLTPFVVGTLGDEAYGIWALVVGLTGYYGLLDLGLRAGLTQYIARYHAEGDLENTNRTASSGVITLGLIGLSVAVLSLLAAAAAPLIFQIPAERTSEVRLVILILGLAASVQFPFFAFSAVLTATQRFDVSNGIGIVTRLISAALTVLALKNGFGLIGVTVATSTANLLDYTLRAVAAYRVLPGLRFSPGLVSRKSCLEFLTFGLWNILIQGGRQLIYYSDVIVIALALPVAYITPYALAVQLINYFNQLMQPASAVFFPVATQLDARGETERLQRLYLSASRMLLCLAVTCAVVAAFCARDFYELWMGQRTGAAESVETTAFLFTLLLVAAVTTAGQRIGYQVFLGMRHLRPLAVLFACEAIANLILSLILVQWFGLVGVALGTLIPSIIFHGCLHPLVLSRTLGLSPYRFVVDVYARSALFGIPLAGCVFAIRHWLGRATSWPELLLQGAVCLLISGMLGLLLALSPAERAQFVYGPTSMILGRRQQQGG